MTLPVYLVEDSPIIRANLVGSLEDLADASVVGFAENEDDALAWLQQHPGDWTLAVVDIFLKGGSGLGVLGGLQVRRPHQKVVALTNYATADMRQRCLSLGADAIFDKSHELDEFFDYCLSVSRTSAKSG